MDSIAILLIEKGRARVMRFRVELTGEANWSLDTHSIADALKRVSPDLVTVVENEKRARWLAEEMRRQGRADTVIFLHPEATQAEQDQVHVNVAQPFDPSQPKQLLTNLAQALVDAQTREPRNPLTGLPGVGVLRKEIERRIGAEKIFTFLYLDIDNFKAFNDYYGFAKGDEILLLLTGLIQSTISEYGAESDLGIHIGGDDFGILTEPERAVRIAEELINKFDAQIPGYYGEQERRLGQIVTKDRRGNEATFPIMTLSIAGVSNQHRTISNYLQVSEIAAEIKSFAKQSPKSAYVPDRRRDK